MRKLTILITALIFTACQSGTVEVDSGKLQVVATVGMVADMVENVGGELVDVESLMGPGVDPHVYKPSTGDVSALEKADIIFFVGLHLEAKTSEVLESLATRKNVVGLGEFLPKEDLLDADAALVGATYDPHIWFDVELWSKNISKVVEVLSEADPENAEIYQTNGEIYLKELIELDQWISETAQEIPEDQRVMITAHDAFNYFGRAYGFEVRGIQGISTASDYGLKDLEELINLIVEKKLKAIFVESSVSSRSIEALQEGAAAEGWEVAIGGQLFSDAMGDPETAEGTYIGMIKHNVNTIVNSLK